MHDPVRYVRFAVVAVPLLLSLASCDSASNGAGGAGGGGSSTGASKATSTSSGADPYPQFASCKKGTLEADRAENPPLTGPGVDADTGKLKAGHYMIATTYLAMVPEQAGHAQELGGAVVQSLPTMHGLVAFALESSQSCASLRTLTVWESEEDMMTFVGSAAHAKAMTEISTLSRGTSNTIAWEGDESAASWNEAASRLANMTGGDL